MTAARTTSARRPLTYARRAAVALAVGAGLVLTPLPAMASAPVPTAASAAAVAAPSHAAKVAMNTALAQRGKPYAWGGSGPNSFDCSGLTKFAYKKAGITLPRTTKTQSKVGAAVAKANLRPGDLVFFYRPISHVGVYIGNGKMVHAPTSGDVVKVTKIDAMGGYAGARRVA
jgi:cell wall-associated NlpC family hydrolase